MYEVLKEWPKIDRYPEALLSLNPQPYLSLDWEWRIRDNKPTILGASDGIRTVSVPHEQGKPYLIEVIRKFPQARILGHNFISADLPVAIAEGIDIPLAQVDDTIIWHWLTNMSLCKGTKKADDEEGEKRGRGFMNLFAMCSAHLAVPNWKECVGEEQCLHEHRPCPSHDPFGYNGNDCYWPVHAMGPMMRRAKLMGVDRLYPLHQKFAAVLSKVRERGVLVDVPYVDKLRTDFEKACEDMRAGFTFNPNSPPQIKAHFKVKGIFLENTEEETIREAVDVHEDSELERLLDYKELGKGPDRWFAPRKFDYDKNNWEGYVDESGYIHCNLQIFTSTGRLACSNPNLQNVAKRRKDRNTGESLGKKIRRAIVAPDGYYLYRADLKNAENRVFLHLAGYHDIPNVDFHARMRDMIGIKEDDPFAISQGNAREAAKTVTHATDYMEGIKLVTESEFRSQRIQREISAGVRIAFQDWKVFGKIVTFTGINLARRAFGDASWDNRRRALSVTMKYFEGFPKLRGLQMEITRQVEVERCVRPPTGYVLASYGYEEDRLKTAAAMWGSNPVAHATKYGMLNVEEHPNLILVLQVHDEFLMYVDCRHEPRKVAGWIRECMEVNMPEIPGLVIPAEPSYGRSWADQKEIPA
jgi:hypothetical protein